MREEGRVLNHVLMRIKMSSSTWHPSIPSLRHFPFIIPVSYGTPRPQCVWLPSSAVLYSSSLSSLPLVSRLLQVAWTPQDNTLRSYPHTVAEETVTEPEPEPALELKVTGSFPSDNPFGRTCSPYPFIRGH